MSPIRDSLLMVRASSDGVLKGVGDSADLFPLITTDSFGLDIEGTPLKGMALHVLVPQAAGATPTLTVNVHAASTSYVSSTANIIASRSGINAVGEYIIPFSTRLRSVAFAFDMTSASGNMSLVTAWVTLAFGQDWTRTVEWH